jgi:hypothetical protein
MKADALQTAEGNSLINANKGVRPKEEQRLADKTAPESKTRSCIYKGNLETWENQMFPCILKRMIGLPLEQNAWRRTFFMLSDGRRVHLLYGGSTKRK